MAAGRVMAGRLTDSRVTLVVEPSTTAVEGVAPETPLLGLPLLRRTVLAARKAGFSRVVVTLDDPTGSVAGALEGTGVEFSRDPVEPEATRLPWNLVVGTKEMKALRAGNPLGGVEVLTDRDLPAARRLLLLGLIKDEEGFMSRHVERRISLAVSRVLASTSVTPNAMTIGSVAIGVLGAVLFAAGPARLQLPGALLFLLHSILDGCDGELARLKFLESRFGGILDFWGDNVVHVAVFLGIGVGAWRATGETWPLWLGLSASLGALLSATWVYRETMTAPKEGPAFTSVTKEPSGTVGEVADGLARRDFIYLVVLLSAFGKAVWFLALAAVGSPIFFLVLLALSWGGRRRERHA